jgi:hypothetical protein
MDALEFHRIKPLATSRKVLMAEIFSETRLVSHRVDSGRAMTLAIRVSACWPVISSMDVVFHSEQYWDIIPHRPCCPCGILYRS